MFNSVACSCLRHNFLCILKGFLTKRLICIVSLSKNIWKRVQLKADKWGGGGGVFDN